MGRLTFAVDDSFRGKGASKGLSRGLLAFFDSHNITQEGMGIGAIALRTDKFTYFSHASKTEIIDGKKIIRTFLINRRLMKAFRGQPSGALTWLYEKATSFYMAVPSFQDSLLTVTNPLGRHLKVTSLFEETEPVGEANVTYIIDRRRVTVECSVSFFRERFCTVYILNELGGDFFHAGWLEGSVISPPSGWQKLPETKPAPSLYNLQHDLRFIVGDIADNNAPAIIFWGRERTEHLCWAGFEFKIDCARHRNHHVARSYVVEFVHGGSHD